MESGNRRSPFSRRKRGLASWLVPTGSPIYYEFEGETISVMLSLAYLLTVAHISILSKAPGELENRMSLLHTNVSH